MNYKLNTGLLPIVDVCMYGGLLDPANIESAYNDFERYNCEEDGTEFHYVDLDYDKFDMAVLEIAAGYIKGEVMPILSKYGVKNIQTLGIYHPREYNFETDQLDFDIELSDDFEEQMRENIVKFQKEDDGRMQQYIDDHWKSYDGFWSYMPESFDEILYPRKYSCHTEQRIGAYLTLCLLKEGWTREDDYLESGERIYEELKCNGWDVWKETEAVAA